MPKSSVRSVAKIETKSEVLPPGVKNKKGPAISKAGAARLETKAKNARPTGTVGRAVKYLIRYGLISVHDKILFNSQTSHKEGCFCCHTKDVNIVVWNDEKFTTVKEFTVSRIINGELSNSYQYKIYGSPEAVALIPVSQAYEIGSQAKFRIELERYREKMVDYQFKEWVNANILLQTEAQV